MEIAIYSRLSLMMFLQFFVWGAWFVTLGSYLGKIGFSGTEIGLSYLTNNIAAIISPLLVGVLADRYFASQKVMATLHLLGAGVIYLATTVTEAWTLIGIFLVYNICYMPTLALANNISFQQMENTDREFPKIRLWGTIGWIAAGLSISFVLGTYFSEVERTAIPMKMASVMSVVLGLYAFTLPNTPPKIARGPVTMNTVFGLNTIKLMYGRSFMVFVICSILISIPLAFYYSFTNLFLNDLGMQNVAAKQSLGQVSEILFMILMPWFFVRLGLKKMLLIGMLAWAFRYALFAMGDVDALAWMLLCGILLHGICYDFFFVVGQIYVDSEAPQDQRASAQGFITLLTYGIGIGIGSLLSGYMLDLFTINELRDWTSFWWVPAIFALIVSIIFAVLFKEKQHDVK